MSSLPAAVYPPAARRREIRIDSEKQLRFNERPRHMRRKREENSPVTGWCLLGKDEGKELI